MSFSSVAAIHAMRSTSAILTGFSPCKRRWRSALIIIIYLTYLLDLHHMNAHQTYCCVFCVNFGCCLVVKRKKSPKVKTFEKKYARPHLTSVSMWQTPPICYSKCIKTNRKNSCTVAFFFTQALWGTDHTAPVAVSVCGQLESQDNPISRP